MAAAASSPDESSARRDLADSKWLFSPGIDLLLISILLWPVILLVCVWGGTDALSGIGFWQVYFVTTPHRWITLVIVFLDRDRFGQRPVSFVALALAVVILCLGVRVSTGTLTCLLTVDYLWNGWHFASQHHGIYRIYGRQAQARRGTPGGNAVQRHGFAARVAMRGFVLYVIARIAQWSWSLPEWEAVLTHVDWFVLTLPCLLVARELVARTATSLACVAYLASVLVLYTSLLLAAHYQRPDLVLILTTLSALFHATEYLTIVTQVVRRKHLDRPSGCGVMSFLAPRWGFTLLTFMMVLGLGSSFAEAHWMKTWLLLNVIVAFLHYGYDGMIWKSRRSGTA